MISGGSFCSSYAAIAEKISGASKRVLSVGVAHDLDLLRSVADAAKTLGICAALFGDAAKIRAYLGEIGFADADTMCEIFDEPDEATAVRASVKRVHDGLAHILMKGQVNTSDFMRAVLDKEVGLRSGRILSHLASFEVRGMERMIFVTDGGINIAPDLSEKKEILQNALCAMRALGYESPKVAVLTANEQVNPKAPATVDAAEITAAWRNGAFKEFSDGCVVEGPIALDVALSGEAARHKGIESRIAGETDLFLVSGIEVGNVLGKSMANIAGAKMAGVVVGASAPIVLTSRAESAESKRNSILLAAGCCSSI